MDNYGTRLATIWASTIMIIVMTIAAACVIGSMDSNKRTMESIKECSSGMPAGSWTAKQIGTSVFHECVRTTGK